MVISFINLFTVLNLNNLSEQIYYYEILEKFEERNFFVNLLAIVYNPKNKMILIGRREKDPYIKKLTWCFPGERLDYKKDLETSLKYEVKKED
jgi:hypothetical protein